jgi:hypothetical protein
VSFPIFEPEGSSSGRRLYTRLPEDEPSGSKIGKDIDKLKITILT